MDENNRRELLEGSLLDYCLRKEIKVPIDGIKIKRTIEGKPEIANLENVHFSISHTNTLYICGVQEIELGLDIEDIEFKIALGEESKGVINNPGKKRFQAIAERFFANAEREYLKANGFNSFFEIWVRKEAFIKAKGTGISEGLNKFSVVSNGKFINSIEGMHIDCLDLKYQLGDKNSKSIVGAYCSKLPLLVENVIQV
ncbi:MAG: 4'-phosphopantetheinyl transferase superfamily protein [Eubacteriales bacterium]